MKDHSKLNGLVTDMIKHRQVLDRMHAFFDEFRSCHPSWRELRTEEAMAAAQFYGNFYTCIETIFVRIAGYFENNLGTDRWHGDLLDRMTCQVPDERQAVIADETARILLEFLKFRHFSRYYFEFDYDRDKLEFLAKKYDQVIPLLYRDLDLFTTFLHDLQM